MTKVIVWAAVIVCGLVALLSVSELLGAFLYPNVPGAWSPQSTKAILSLLLSLGTITLLIRTPVSLSTDGKRVAVAIVGTLLSVLVNGYILYAVAILIGSVAGSTDLP